MDQDDTVSLSPTETRHRLLEAAGEVFADLGFQRATIRDICQRAGANVAAVNYHFRDKEGLYAEVLRYSHQCSLAKQKEGIAAMAGGSVPAEQRLRMFIRTFLLRAFDSGRQSWHGKLVAREMTEPTQALDGLVQDEIRPRAMFLEQTIHDLLGPGATQDVMRRCARSVVSQCVFYHQCRPVIQRLHPEQGFDPDDLQALADYIADFSLAGIAGIAKQLKEQP